MSAAYQSSYLAFNLALAYQQFQGSQGPLTLDLFVQQTGPGDVLEDFEIVSFPGYSQLPFDLQYLIMPDDTNTAQQIVVDPLTWRATADVSPIAIAYGFVSTDGAGNVMWYASSDYAPIQFALEGDGYTVQLSYSWSFAYVRRSGLVGEPVISVAKVPVDRRQARGTRRLPQGHKQEFKRLK